MFFNISFKSNPSFFLLTFASLPSFPQQQKCLYKLRLTDVTTCDNCPSFCDTTRKCMNSHMRSVLKQVRIVVSPKVQHSPTIFPSCSLCRTRIGLQTLGRKWAPYSAVQDVMSHVRSIGLRCRGLGLGNKSKVDGCMRLYP